MRRSQILDIVESARSVVRAYDLARERGQDVRPVGVRVAIQYLRATIEPEPNEPEPDNGGGAAE